MEMNFNIKTLLKMKKLILKGIINASLILLFITGAGAQKIGSYASLWHPGLPVEDEESLINMMQYHEKSQFLFLISNDEKNLYVDLMVAEKASIQKIMRFGLTTWFNPEGKHKKEMGIQFPVTMEGKDEQNFKKDRSGGDRKEMRMAMMASKNEEMELIGFGGKGEQKFIDPRSDSAFYGKVEMTQNGTLKISLVVPLAKILQGNDEAAKTPISVGFESGYLDLTRQGMPQGGGQQSGGDMHGGGGYGGGMPGGGPPQGGGQGNQAGGGQQKQPEISELASPSKLWISQVILAVKPR
jgi:hypothetical protein